MLMGTSSLHKFVVLTTVAGARVHCIGSSVLPVPTEQHPFPEWALMALFGLVLLGTSAILRRRMRT